MSNTTATKKTVTHFTHYILLSIPGAKPTIPLAFWSPDDEFAAKIARAYTKSLAAHYKKTPADIKHDYLRLIRTNKKAADVLA